MGYTAEEERFLAIEIFVLSTISAIMLLFTIICYLTFTHLQNAQFKLVSRILFQDLIYELILFFACLFNFIYPDAEPLSYTHPIIC